MESCEDTKKSDSPVEETFDSWTILGNSGILPISGNVTVLVNDDDAAHKEDKNSTIEESVEKKSSNILQVPDADDNDSDGISVISENDLYKNSDAEDAIQGEKYFPKLNINKFAMKNLLNDVLMEEDQLKFDPITPPQTPHENKSTTPEKVQKITSSEKIPKLTTSEKKSTVSEKKSTVSEKKSTVSEEKSITSEKKPKTMEKQILNTNNQEIQTTSMKRFSFKKPSRFDSFRICTILILAGILVATIGIVANVKVDSHNTNTNYEHRITNLLLENQLLRVKLEIMELQNTQRQQQAAPIEEPKISVVVETFFSPIPEEIEEVEEIEQVEEKPTIVTTQVYSGEEDKIIEILDSRYLLPPYCYFSEKDDLFHEYNVLNCQKKKKKLAKKLRFLHKDKSTPMMEQFGLEDATEDKSKMTGMRPVPKFDIFDLLIQLNKDDDDDDEEPTETTDTLIQPIVEEVQEIRRKRKHDDSNKENVPNKQRYNDKSTKKRKNERPEDNIGDTNDFEDWKEKTKKLPQLKNKKKGEFENCGSGDKKEKWNRKTDKTIKKREEKTDDWVEKRGSAREDARKQKKEDKSNWILERGNEREINRINCETTE